jgi:hypothetical protein
MAIFTFGADEGLVPNGQAISATYPNRLTEISQPFSPAEGIPDLIVVAEHLFLGRVQQDDYSKPLKVTWGPVAHNGINISGQLLLHHLMRKLGLPEANVPVRRFQWPADYPFGGQFSFQNPAQPGAPLPPPA